MPVLVTVFFMLEGNLDLKIALKQETHFHRLVYFAVTFFFPRVCLNVAIFFSIDRVKCMFM